MGIRRLVLALAAILACGGVAAAAASGDLAAAHGAGLGSWWAANGKATLTAAACFLDGVGLSALFVGGVTGVGGVAAAAGLVVAALVCTTS
jgi:hypothetical protein